MNTKSIHHENLPTEEKIKDSTQIKANNTARLKAILTSRINSSLFFIRWTFINSSTRVSKPTIPMKRVT